MNEKILEFFKDPSKYIKRLLQESLDDKWHENSHTVLFSPCPFCLDLDERMNFGISLKNPCWACFCPPEICRNGGNGGMIDDLTVKHITGAGNRTRLMDLSEPELHGMITLFKNRIDNLDCRD